jgi:hypothetical protein
MAVSISNARLGNNSAGHGLKVLSLGNITLNTVDASKNGSYGAILDNQFATPAMTVSITSSTFNSNAGNGLEVYSMGSITLTGVEASSNTGGGHYGAYLVNSYSGATGGVTITGSSAATCKFTGNAAYGLNIHSGGAVTLNYIDTRYNTGYGVDIDGRFGVVNGMAVSISNARLGNNSAGYGLQVVSYGNITLNTVDASKNGSYGATLDNRDAIPAMTMSITSSTFNSNAGNGLVVYSKGGITLTGVEAASNTGGGYGADLDNNWPFATDGVTITGSSAVPCKFTGNANYGLNIDSKGAVTLNYLDTRYNTGVSYGLNIKNDYVNGKEIGRAHV